MGVFLLLLKGSLPPPLFSLQAASSWNHDHTVWGVVADDESMAVVETIVKLPAVAPKPGDMHMMSEREPFTIAVAK